MKLETGAVIDEYKIVGVIGSGGSGRVFKVEHIITKRIEAIKILSGRPDARAQAQRFLREIQLAAKFTF